MKKRKPGSQMKVTDIKIVICDNAEAKEDNLCFKESLQDKSNIFWFGIVDSERCEKTLLSYIESSYDAYDS